MTSRLRLLRAAATPTLRLYLRRSREDHQEFSIDTQRAGAEAFVGGALRARLADGCPSWPRRVEYVDDLSGGEFLDRPGLGRLLKETRPGDVVVCRDPSRLGRDMLETALVLRTLVSEKGARLFYYADGAEQSWNDVTDKVLALARGLGPEYERQAIRSRTREALRQRVRLGRLAGGACYGYRNDRRADEAGRAYTVQVIDDEQAQVVRRVFELFVQGHGPRSIAKRLNAEGVAPPRQRRRGTGSWSPGALREMLRRDRYRGLAVHGEWVTVDRGGGRVRVRAPSAEVLRVDAPHLRILPDDLWAAAQLAVRRRRTVVAPSPNRRHPLSGVGRCGQCGGPMMVANNRDGRVNRRAYCCGWHRDRGEAVCTNRLRRSQEVVEAALAEHLRREVLTEDLVAEVLRRVRGRLEELRSQDNGGVLQAEAQSLRVEIQNLVRAIARTPDSPALAAALQEREDRLRALDVEVEARRRAPEIAGAQLRDIEEQTRERLGELRAILERRDDGFRTLIAAMYPKGLRFHPEGPRRQRRYRVEGEAALGCVMLDSVPSGFGADLTRATSFVA